MSGALAAAGGPPWHDGRERCGHDGRERCGQDGRERCGHYTIVGGSGREHAVMSDRDPRYDQYDCL